MPGKIPGWFQKRFQETVQEYTQREQAELDLIAGFPELMNCLWKEHSSTITARRLLVPDETKVTVAYALGNFPGIAPMTQRELIQLRHHCQNNRELVELLRDADFDVTYWEPEIGAHEWPFWNAWIDCALDWYAPGPMKPSTVHVDYTALTELRPPDRQKS